MTADHADHRRRLYLGMLTNPDGIIAPDYETEPTLDGGPRIPRVAPRMLELREEHDIPLGLRRGAFALYRLTRAGDGNVRPLRAGNSPQTPRPHHGRDGFTPVMFCGRCLATFPAGHTCAHGRLEQMQSGSGPMRVACPNTNEEVEERHAA